MVRSNLEAVTPFFLIWLRKSRNIQWGSKSRVCWYKRMRYLWKCNQKTPRKMLTVEDNDCHVYELQSVQGFDNVARSCRSKGNWIREWSFLISFTCRLDIEKHSRIVAKSNNNHLRQMFLKYLLFNQFLLWILHSYIFGNKENYFIIDFVLLILKIHLKHTCTNLKAHATYERESLPALLDALWEISRKYFINTYKIFFLDTLQNTFSHF